MNVEAVAGLVMLAFLAGACGGSGSSGGMCPAAAELIRPAPVCNTLAKESAVANYTARSGQAPAQTGGRLADGFYYAMQLDGYGDGVIVPEPQFRETLAILDSGTQMLVGRFPADDASPIGPDWENFAITVSGTRIETTSTCASRAVSGAVPTVEYSVTATGLVVAESVSGSTAVTTYGRRGCP